MYRFAICDDDREFCGFFADCLRKICGEKRIDFTVSVFYDTASFADSLQKGEAYDLVFLDILLKDENGIDFARTLRAKNCAFDLVFISACREYAVDSYDVAPLHYILKPVSREKVETALERFLEKHAPQTLRFSVPKGAIQIPLAEIVYFEVYNHDIIVHKTDGSAQSFRGMTLRELEGSFPLRSFARSHRSYLVNLEHISEIMKYQIRLSTGETIPISKRLYPDVMRRLIDYDDKMSDVF